MFWFSWRQSEVLASFPLASFAKRGTEFPLSVLPALTTLIRIPDLLTNHTPVFPTQSRYSEHTFYFTLKTLKNVTAYRHFKYPQYKDTFLFKQRGNFDWFSRTLWIHAPQWTDRHPNQVITLYFILSKEKKKMNLML